MRIYVIGNDGITLCREAPATVNEGEIAVASKEDLHAAPPTLGSVALVSRCSIHSRTGISSVSAKRNGTVNFL